MQAGTRSAHQVANAILCCVQDAMVNANRPQLSRAYVAAGEIAWDDCCGQLVVAPVRMYRSAAFPAEDGERYLCTTGVLSVELLVLLMRCVPTVDDRGRAPTSKQLDDAYKSLLDDAAVIWNAVICCDLDEDWDRANLSQTFVGAEGGCVGVETRITIGVELGAWL